ncbi:TrmH RNA methyltransferase [Cricetibacter osteomyelitidis]|uniref:TrmH RNA methyltransferase n=1 Tax=Cricetibacter osteomyelitidis TaxID=1521931 RepID=A0A4R2SWG7_9PAST|nr:tRNA/rRNA methyltransferase [Cricetibacter osteomyelitidis]TCP93221.1 TrmH RNA methyltransferase [Cricetibacter osteomyelitidis]
MKKPIFQQADNGKRFQQRDSHSRNERSERSRNRNEKSAENKPHFGNKKPFNKKPFADRSEQTAPQISETTLQTVRGNHVKVLVKGDGVGFKEKKTGPLSPRAPEKIRKNRSEEMKVYGENACLALFAERPKSIVRLWANVEIAKKIGEITGYLAANKRAYHIVDNQELELVSGTEHHGGICLLVKKQRAFGLKGYLDVPRQQDCLLLLDGVRNAHNIGGVLRTAAFYGVKGVIVDDAELLNSAAAMRVAEGGMEFIKVLETDCTDNALQQLRDAGYQIVHITRHKQAKSLGNTQFADKVVFILSEAVNEQLNYPQDTEIVLSHNNPLKNGLNVAVTAGVLLAKWYFR